MIISHFARLSSIFWIKGSIKHSEWMAEEKRKRRGRDCGWGEKLMKGVLRYLVWLYYELILLVLRKFNYTQDNTCLNVCVCVFLESMGAWLCVRRERPPPSAHSEQTPDRAPSRMAVRMSVPCERSKSSVALCSNHQGIYCPHDEQGERIKRTGWREERGEIDEKEGKQQTRAMQEWKEKQGRRRKKGKLKAEWLSMAERGRESKNERWETDGEKRDWGRQRWRGKAEEGTIRVKMNGELKTSGLKAS